MYQPPQQKKSSWTPSTAQNKSKSSSKLGHFSIQPKSQQISPPPQEIGEYSRESADRLAANVMRGLQAKEQEQAETSTVQRQYESPWAPTFDVAPPITQTPASQISRDTPWRVSTFAPVSENPIQRQCAECAKEEQSEQLGKEGKEVDQISAASSNIQTKLTTGESGEIKEPTVNPRAAIMSKPIFSAHTPQVQQFSPQENPRDIWARAQAIGPTMEKSVDHRNQMAAMIQRAFEMGRKEAAVQPVQAKLTLGEPGDKYEQEADAVARTVVEQINTPKTGESVHRESESHPFTSLANPPISVSSVIRQSPGSVGEGASVSQDVEQGIQQAKGGGKGLNESVREPMEQAFGADFSGVRVHADGNADQLNRSISARAFTTGQDIFFKQGEYNPGNRGGQELLAHELTHVVQQTGEGGIQLQRQITIQRKTATSDPQQLIDQYTSWLNLNEEKLAKDLLSRMSGQSDFVVKVFRTLSRSDRDDVACYLLENASDEQIKSFAQDPGGKRVLTLMLAELADGTTGNDEEKQRDRVLRLVPSDTPQLTDQEKKREAKEQQKENAVKLIDKHTHGLNLREEELAEDLLKRLPGESSLAEQVLDTLDSTDRDDVSVSLLESATDGQIKNIAKDANGRTLLLRMVQELYKGDMGDDERKQMQRTMDFIAQVDQEKRSASKNDKPLEVEVITFLYGGKFLDALGVVLAGGSKGHTLIVVGDLVYSFELGWSCGKTKAEYLSDNNWRDGIGQVLNLNQEDAEKVQKRLNASCGKGAYIISGDICTDSSAQALEGVLAHLKSGWNPQRFVGYLEDTGQVKSHRFYPKKTEVTSNPDKKTPQQEADVTINQIDETPLSV